MSKITIITPPVAHNKIDCDLVELTKLINSINPDIVRHGCLGGEFGYGAEYKNNVFEMRGYYWGDCDCGYEDKEIEWYEKHHHSDQCYQADYNKLPENLWLDNEKEYNKQIKVLCKKHNIPYDNGRGSAVHCTCNYSKEWKEFISQNDHKPTCSLVLPNFKHYKSGFEVRWYKWIGRDSEYSKEPTWKEWQKIIDECVKSLTTP